MSCMISCDISNMISCRISKGISHVLTGCFVRYSIHDIWGYPWFVTWTSNGISNTISHGISPCTMWKKGKRTQDSTMTGHAISYGISLRKIYDIIWDIQADIAMDIPYKWKECPEFQHGISLWMSPCHHSRGYLWLMQGISGTQMRGYHRGYWNRGYPRWYCRWYWKQVISPAMSAKYHHTKKIPGYM